MGHDIRNPQSLGPQKFDHEGVDRLLPQRVVGTGQIDQIRVVRDRVTDSQFGERALKAAHIVVGQLLGPPLVVVLGEQLDAIAAGGLGNLDGLVIAAGNRHVSSQ